MALSTQLCVQTDLARPYCVTHYKYYILVLSLNEHFLQFKELITELWILSLVEEWYILLIAILFHL